MKRFQPPYRYFFLFLLLYDFILLPMKAFGDEKIWKPSGEILMRFYQDTTEKSSTENTQALDTRVQWNNDFRLNNGIFATLNFEGRSENFFGGITENNLDFFLREAFIESRHEHFNLSLGQQKVTWGKLDDVIILDRMNPQDLQWFLLFDKQKRKLPNFMFKHSYYNSNWHLESIFMPTFTPSKMNFFGSDWAVFGRLKEAIAQDSFSDSIKSTVSSITIEEKDTRTDNSLKNSQAGLRLRSQAKNIDYSLYYMSIFHSIPTLREKTSTGNTVKQFLYEPTTENLTTLTNAAPTATDLTLEKEHPRTNILGLDWETVLGAYGIRGEAGLLFDLPYLRRDYSYTTKNTLSFALGADHAMANNLYLNVQFIENYIFDYEDLFAQERNTQQFTGTMTKNYWNGNLTLNLDWAWNTSHRDWMMNPEIKYKFQNNLNIAVGAFLYEGALTTVLGRYTAKDLTYLEMKYQF